MKVISFFIVLTLSALSGLYASSPKAQPHRIPERCVLRSQSVKIPIRFYKKRPYVKVQINDSKTFWFLLDTGASTCILNESTVDELFLFTQSCVSESYAFTGVLKTDSVCNIKKLQIGDALFLNFDADVVSLKEKNTKRIDGIEVGGILGFPLFYRCLLTLDYGNKTLSLSQGSLPPLNGRDILQLQSFSIEQAARLNALPIVNLQLDDGRWIGGILDSGFVNFFAMSDIMFYKLAPDQNLQTIPFQTISSASGAKQTVRYGRIPKTFHLGKFAYKSPLALVIPSLRNLPVEMTIIGNEILKNMVITFDQQQASVRIQPSGVSSTIDYRQSELRIGKLNFSFNDVYWTVPEDIRVRGKTLLRGDIILFVDDQPVAEIDRESWRQLVKKKRSINLTILRGDKMIDVLFPLVFLSKTGAN